MSGNWIRVTSGLTGKKIKSRGLPHIAGKAAGIAFGFFIAIAMGIFIGIAFGMTMQVDGDAMAPSLQTDQTVSVNRIAYTLMRPKRMDLVAFELGSSGSGHRYIRRVVGLPGETVQITDGHLLINGEILDYPYNDALINDAGIAAEPVTLGLDTYFALGDNYNACTDSRNQGVGTIAKKQLIGRAR